MFLKRLFDSISQSTSIEIIDLVVVACVQQKYTASAEQSIP